MRLLLLVVALLVLFAICHAQMDDKFLSALELEDEDLDIISHKETTTRTSLYARSKTVKNAVSCVGKYCGRAGSAVVGAVKKVATAVAFNNLVYCKPQATGIDYSGITELELKHMPIAYELAKSVYEYDPSKGLPKSLGALKFVLRNTEGKSGIVDVLESDDTLYIVGRGTQTLEDAVVDVKSIAAKQSVLGGKISKAFYDAAQKRSDDIDDLIDSAVDQGKVIIATGHSLGAVTSRIKLLMYAESRPGFENYENVYHIGFGTPAFGDQSSQDYIAKKYAKFHIIDVKDHMNGRVDVVTRTFGKATNHAKVVLHFHECPGTVINYLKRLNPLSLSEHVVSHFMTNYNLSNSGYRSKPAMPVPDHEGPTIDDLD
ncbi:lipase [Acrasis kona]|uniref:Lipase n=1 Tax=Acrasis kona TaxID=1008807 RepID=A0AAW2ZG72_9EUKA